MATRSSISRFDAASFHIDPVTGDLHAKVFPTKAGVFLYRNADGSERRELRPRSEVFRADSMPILNWKPFTNDHPERDGKQYLLDQSTADAHRKGLVFNHTRADDNLHTQAEVIVTNKDQIALIQAGKRAVSCGYDCDEDLTPGVDPEFGPYDLIQRNIRYNHLANVDRGRAGDGAQIRMDHAPSARFDAVEIEIEAEDPEEEAAEEAASEDMQKKPGMAGCMDTCETGKPKTDNQKRSPTMDKFDVDGHLVEVSEPAKIALTNKFKNDSALLQTEQQKVATEKTRADQAETALQTEKTRADRAEADLVTAKADLEKALRLDVSALVQARAALQNQAADVLGKDTKFDGLTDRAIKEQVIKKVFDYAEKEKPLAERSDDFVEAMYTNATAAGARTDEKDPVTGAYAGASAQGGQRADSLEGHYSFLEQP